jgi:hypothetical protein
MADGHKHSTAGWAYDTVAKLDNLFTTRSYAGPAAKMFITAGYSARRGPLAHEPTVIRTTAGCLKTVDESRGGD